MIVDIGNIILEKIETLPFIDKATSIVHTITQKERNSDGNGFIIKKYPASCQTTLDECSIGKRYLDFVPDNKKKSILFMEDNGSRVLKREGHYTYWQSNLDLVCWLNLPLLGSNGCSYSSIAISAILKRLTVQQFNALNLYQYILINVRNQKPKSQNPYSKYTIDETTFQYLVYPFDYFVLEIEVLFRIDDRCLTIEQLEPAINCIKK